MYGEVSDYFYAENIVVEKLQSRLKDDKIQDELKNNKDRVGDIVYSQNFYLNPAYQGVTFSIEPGQSLTLEDAIIFEPRTLTSSKNQMQMTLYIKTQKVVL